MNAIAAIPQTRREPGTMPLVNGWMIHGPEGCRLISSALLWRACSLSLEPACPCRPLAAPRSERGGGARRESGDGPRRRGRRTALPADEGAREAGGLFRRTV